MHVHSPIFHGQLKEKKIRRINLIVWVLGRMGKNPKKGSKNELFLDLVIKKLWAILDFL